MLPPFSELWLVLEDGVAEGAARLFCEPLGSSQPHLQINVAHLTELSRSSVPSNALLVGTVASLQQLAHLPGRRLVLSLPPASGGGGSSDEPLHLALLGSEASGKTSLAVELANAGMLVQIPEYVRLYVDAVGKSEVEDLPFVVAGALLQRRAYERLGAKLFLHDTELWSTAVYAEMLFGEMPPWLALLAQGQSFAAGIVLGCDLPWESDGQRVFSQRAEREEFLSRLLRRWGDRTVIDLRQVAVDQRREVLRSELRQLPGARISPCL